MLINFQDEVSVVCGLESVCLDLYDLPTLDHQHLYMSYMQNQSSCLVERYLVY